MKHFNHVFYTTLILLCIVACKKDNLPEATQNGANTFECKIDGVTFKPGSKGGASNNLSVLYVVNSHDYNYFVIAATNELTDQYIYIAFTYLTQSGTYELRQFPYTGTYKQGHANPVSYTTDTVNTGELVITRCDNSNRIYSGTFSFTCKEPNTGKIVRITDGRFDLKE